VKCLDACEARHPARVLPLVRDPSKTPGCFDKNSLQWLQYVIYSLYASADHIDITVQVIATSPKHLRLLMTGSTLTWIIAVLKAETGKK